MILLPYRTFTIETDLKKEDVIAAVRRHVRPVKYSIWKRSNTVVSQFNGITSAEGFSISVSREQTYLFEAVITGDITTSYSGTRVNVVADLATWISILAVVLLTGMTVVFVYSLTLRGEEFDFTLFRSSGLGILVFYGVLMYMFLRDFLFARRRLLEILSGRLVDPHSLPRSWNSK